MNRRATEAVASTAAGPTGSGLRHGDVERAARNVLLSPLHGQDVVPPLLDHVGHVVLLIAHVLHGDFFAGGGGPVDPDQQHVGTCGWGWEGRGRWLRHEDALKKAEEEEGRWEPKERSRLLPTLLGCDAWGQ